MRRRRRRSRSRRDIENANFKRQAQALIILTIGTAVLGAALFQTDISIYELFSTAQAPERIQAAAVLITTICWMIILSGTINLLTTTRRITSKEVAHKTAYPLLWELLSAAGVFFTGMLIN